MIANWAFFMVVIRELGYDRDREFVFYGRES